MSWRDVADEVVRVGYGGNVHWAFPGLAEAEFFLQHKRGAVDGALELREGFSRMYKIYTSK